jgi:hypothetical protein
MKDLKIDINADCRNAPKKEFLRDFNIAFARADTDFILKSISDDIVWDIFGDKKIEGKDAFTAAVNDMSAYNPEELTIHNIITHGREAAVNGEFQMAGNKRYAFCDVYEFVSAGKNIIRHLYTYVVLQK